MKHCPRAVSIARPSTLQLTALPSELAAAPAILEERYVVLQYYTLLFIICLFNYKYKSEYFVLDMAFRSPESRTTKTWVTNLIKPVLIMMQFVRAEREGDWSLHLAATMIPYFFASGHFNYARYQVYMCIL